MTLPSLMLIAQAIFREQTDRQADTGTDATDYPNSAGVWAMKRQ